MRTWSSFAISGALLGACGPIYPDPPAPASPPPPSAGPPSGEGQWSSSSAPPARPANPYREEPPPAAAAPDDPYAAPAPDEPRAAPRVEPPIGPAPPPDLHAAPGRLPANAQALIDAHNRVRAQHCAPPLRWSPQLAQFAQKWANSLRDDGCKFGHSGGRYGENLAAGTAGTLDAQSVTDMWYREIAKYSFGSGAFSMETGHFTQVVWRGSTQLGCAVATCRNMDIWVCEYDPPGNVQGEFKKNVQPKGCR